MNYVVLTILLIAGITDPLKIGKINRAKKQAREAYVSGDYKTAVSKFKYLIDSLGVHEDALSLNLANAYFQLKDTANALTSYQALVGSEEKMVRSKAQHQLGIMSHQKGKLEEALDHFKQAIKADPTNTDARYNYEMVKRKLEEKKKQDENQNKKDNKDQNKPPEPSEFAKKLKAQADALAAEFKFQDALSVMNEGAKKDPSVMYYKEFMKRLEDVTGINSTKKK
jgi:tetratricopeptide (TPR) repeat protein